MGRYLLLRKQLEMALDKISLFIYDKAGISLLLCLSAVAFLLFQSFTLRYDSSIEHYLQENDPALAAYTRFQNQFGSDDKVIIGVIADTVFSASLLDKLASFQLDLESGVPHISQVKSLLNAPYIADKNQELHFGNLSDITPKKEDDVLAFKKFVISSPLYSEHYFSQDERLALIVLNLSCPGLAKNTSDVLAELTMTGKTDSGKSDIFVCALSNAQNKEMIDSIEQIRQNYQQDGFDIHITGMPLLRQFLRTVMKEDMKKFIIMSFALVTLLLYMLFGNLTGVVLPLFVVTCTIVSTIGLMAMINLPFQAPTRILPSFLIAVAIGASVHILVIFFQLRQRGMEDRKAVGMALAHSGLPVILTSITTAAGLASFSTAKITPVADLGLFSAIGVLFSLIFTLTLLPALLAIFPPRTNCTMVFTRFSEPTRLLVKWLTTFTIRNAGKIVLTCMALLFIAILGICRIQLVHNPLLRLPDDAPLRTSTEAISKHYPGLASVEIVAATGEKDALASPSVARKFRDFATDISSFANEAMSVYSVFSVYNIIDELHRVLTAPKESGPVSSHSRELLAQEFLLLEGGIPQSLKKLTDTGHQLARVTVMLPWIDAMAYDPFFHYLKNAVNNHLSGIASVEITGIVPLLSRTIRAAIESMVMSYIIAFITISVIMILLIGHTRLGLLSMLPNLLPICLTLGLMGWAGIHMDMYALLIGSIALGLVVDDTIHFMHNFRRYYDQTGSVEQAVQLTLSTSGMAMLLTTLVLSGGAFVFMLSEMNNLRHFGMLTGIAVFLALLADFFLAPALMSLYYAKKDKPSHDTQPYENP